MSVYSDRVIADGASAYWRLDETSGLTAVDVVGGRNGTISGGVTLGVAGALSDGSTAMLFDATGDWVSVPNGPYAAIGTGPVTVECWIKPTVVPATAPFFVENGGGANGPGFALLLPTPTAVSFKIANGTTNAIVSAVMTVGQWHHVVGVVTRGTPDGLQIFVNGVAGPIVNPPANGWNVSSPRALLFGTYSGGEASPDFRYFGTLDEVAIYPRALTAPEIAAHYEIATARPAMPVWGLMTAGDVTMTPYNDWRPITPSDSVNLPGGVTDGLYVGGGGTVAAVMGNNTMPIALTVVGGAYLPIAVKRINVTGTTATGLVALYFSSASEMYP